MAEQLDTDVAIVGAGLAGLVAARRLAAAGREPLVIEAGDRVGGRILNEEIGDGKVLEVGGQWIGPTQDRLAALAAELGVSTFPTWDSGRHLIELEPYGYRWLRIGDLERPIREEELARP